MFSGTTNLSQLSPISMRVIGYRIFFHLWVNFSHNASSFIMYCRESSPSHSISVFFLRSKQCFPPSSLCSTFAAGTEKGKKKKIQSCSMCCELSLMTLSLPPSAPSSSTTWLRGVWLCCCASREWPCSTTHPSLSETLCSSLLCHHTPFSICWSCHETNKEDKSFWVGRSNDVRMSFHHFGPGTLGRISMWYAHIW